ncbi:hypothetical protein CMV16_26135 [Peribacillus simplex]|nr:hypothetical protein CMV16_26135 [Peribacillus simplex]
MFERSKIHISHEGQPSHVSQSLRSQNSFVQPLRWIAVTLPHRVKSKVILEQFIKGNSLCDSHDKKLKPQKKPQQNRPIKKA